VHNQGGGKPGICIHPEVFRHHFRFYKKGDVDLWCLVKAPEQTIDYMYCKPEVGKRYFIK